MTETFDLFHGLQRKDEGMKSAAEAKADLLAWYRVTARVLARRDPNQETNADAVSIYMEEYGHPPLGPAAGSLFKRSEWEFTGRRVIFKRVANHGRELKVWRLK